MKIIPELSTPFLMLSQERSPTIRREERSRAGEIMSDKNRVLEEVRVSTRLSRDNIAISAVIPSLRMFLELQGTGLALLEYRKYSSRGERRARKARGMAG